jgi:exosortase/archaeosortase family protein
VQLPNIRLHVDYACSAVRYLLSFLTFGIAYAFRFKKSMAARVATVLFAFPLSIAGGVIRLWIIYFTSYHISPYFAEHRPHVALSWTVFTVFLAGSIAVDRYVEKRRLRD